MKVRNHEEEKRKTTPLQQQQQQRQQQRSSGMQSGGQEERKKQHKIPLQRLQNSATPRRERREQGQEEDGDGGGGGKTVVVGIRMDSQSRELLTWALVKVASPGDLVVALHVLPSAASRDSPPDVDVMSSSSLLSLVKAFDSVLAVYDGFCNLKQIELKMKICRGSSIRKVLVHEARSYGAARLILGVNKNVRTIGSSCTSVAKYCAKKLSPECAVLAVNNGKVVFQREASSPAPPSTAAVNDKADDATLISAQACQSTKKSNTSSSSLRRSATVMRRSPGRATAANGVTEGRSRSVSCFAVARDREPPAYGERTKEEPLAIVPVKKREAPLSSLSALFRDVSEARPGWPFLRRAVPSHKETTHHEEKSRMSVVQWAMRLPSRYTGPPVAQGGRKAIKSDAKVTSEPDEEDVGIIPVCAYESTSTSSGNIKEEGKIPEELKFLEEKYASVCRLFSYEELVHITGNFSPENLVGKGGSSRVFRGHLEDGKELAVKILKPSEDDAMKEFVSEIEIITALHHKNIVSLFGFCFENDNLILVYDFLSRGSLEDNLHGEGRNKSPLSWGDRYKVALGVAEALDYLHGADIVQPVIHRDVKSSNILLNDDFDPQLSDFGLAMWASASVSQLTCNDVAGTFGYLAPEYFMYGKINEKTDVYAFGVVLLELVSGRKPVNTGCPKGEESLVMWAVSILQGGKVKQLVDPCLGTDYDEGQLQRVILAASLCIKRAPRSRPCMQDVLKLLRGDGEMLRWATSQVGTQEGVDEVDEEATLCCPNNIQSHINLALLDIDDDSVSVSSTEPVDFLTANKSLEEYLQGRWSRSSSFD